MLGLNKSVALLHVGMAISACQLPKAQFCSSIASERCYYMSQCCLMVERL